MSELQGRSYIGYGLAGQDTHSFYGLNPPTGEQLEPAYHAASSEEIERAATLAEAAFPAYAQAEPAQRAAFLREVASGLEAEGEAIVSRADQETALGPARLKGELGRTCAQLRLFAELLEEGSWVDARIDPGDPERKPNPKPDVRSLRRPLGPVAVFGASNFPLAFSVAGGDTAAALAAGCPVIFKAHPAHPGTSELVGQVIVAAARACGLPEGVFSLLFDDGHEVGSALVQHPVVKAVGFTGSRAGGEALVRLATARLEPIPVYAEMGSVNPIFILPGALAGADNLAAGLHASFTQGVGQFCTNPGVVLLPSGSEGDALRERLLRLTAESTGGVMLSAGIHRAYGEGLKRLQALGAHQLTQGQEGSTACGHASLWEVEVKRGLEEPGLLYEVFGPSTLLLRYKDLEQLLQFAGALEGQLTATLMLGEGEAAQHGELLRLLERKVGRLIINAFPTGVEVGPAMVHGGPVPATSDGRSTSVGTHAIERFTRYVAYQNFSQEALPAELQDANPRGIWRRVNGQLEHP